MKFIHDQQPLGVRMALRATPEALDDMTDECPCCRIVPEDQTHFLQCTSNPTLTLALQTFQQSLHKKALHALYYLFSFGLLQWFASGTVPAPLE